MPSRTLTRSLWHDLHASTSADAWLRIAHSIIIVYLKDIIYRLFHLGRTLLTADDFHASHALSLSHCKKLILKPSSYPAWPVLQQSLTPIPPVGPPIHVTEKGRCRRRIKNIFAENCGFPDPSEEYDTLLHNIDGGTVLQKLRHPAPPLDENDPRFNFTFNEALHGERLRQQLDLSHLDSTLCDWIYALIKRYWLVFDKHGVWMPVKNYKCVINTGNAHPSQSRKSTMGLKKFGLCGA